MELTPQLLTDEIDFRIAVRGYDRNEVDDFLERVAVAVGQLQAQLTKAVTRAKTAEARVAELEAGTAPGTTAPAGEAATVAAADASDAEARTVVPPVEAPAAVPVPKAPPAAPVPAIGDDEDLNDELRRTLVLAQRTADTAIREAHEEARTIVEQANDEARRNRETAEAAHAKAREEAHGRLVAEIRELESTRESMRNDTVALERYLGTERARVRETIQVLRRLVDEPEAFRPGPVPELSGVSTPADLEAVTPSRTDDADIEALSDDEPDTPAPADESPDAATMVVGDVPPAEAATEPPAVSETADTAGSSGPAATPEDDESGDDAEAAGATEAAGEARTGSPESDADRLGQLFGAADSTKDWRAGGMDRGDQGPHTQPVAAARFESESDEAFLAELRRAMSDDEPLGPGDKD